MRVERRPLPGASVAGGSADPGPGFSEVGQGTAQVHGKVLPATARLRMVASDRAAFARDPEHRLHLEGTFQIGERSVPVEGELHLMEKRGNAHFLVYNFASPAGTRDPVRFTGAKEVFNDRGFDILHDTTVVHGRLLEAGEPVDGISASYHPTVRLVFPGSYLRYAASFGVPHARNPVQVARGLGSLVGVFLGGLKTFFFPWTAPKERQVPGLAPSVRAHEQQ